MKSAVTAASRRLLKITCWVSRTFAGRDRARRELLREVVGLREEAEAAVLVRRSSASPRVIVTASSQASGSAVARPKRGRPDFTKIVVAQASAVAASSWLAMPKSGQSELMPPSGSTTPW